MSHARWSALKMREKTCFSMKAGDTSSSRQATRQQCTALCASIPGVRCFSSPWKSHPQTDRAKLRKIRPASQILPCGLSIHPRDGLLSPNSIAVPFEGPAGGWCRPNPASPESATSSSLPGQLMETTTPAHPLAVEATTHTTYLLPGKRCHSYSCPL